MSALSILQLAQALLTGGTIAKAEPTPKEPDADDIQGHDARTDGGAPTEEQLEAARTESQAGQQAAAAQGAPGGGEGQGGGAGGSSAPEPDGDEGNSGPGDGDGDEGGEVTKAEILASISFLASHHKIPAEEVAKALGFSGGEGDPTAGKAPVGQGIELLQKIAESQEGMNKVLDAIAGFLAELSKQTVSLGTEIGKSMEAAEAAMATAEGTATQLAGIMKLAPAMPAKAHVEVSKALPEGGSGPKITSQDLFKAALKGDLSPTQIANANRCINYNLPVTL